MKKIDHTKSDLLSALDVDSSLLTDIKLAFVSTISNIMMDHSMEMQDSRILYSSFLTLKQNRWDISDISETEKDVEKYIAGTIIYTLMERFKERFKERGSSFIEKEKEKDDFPADMPEALKDILRKIKSVPGAKVIIGKANNLEELLKSSINTQQDDKFDSSSDSFFIKDNDSDSDLLDEDDGSNSGEENEPIADVSKIEEHIKNNLDNIPDNEIRYFVDVIKKCEEVCPFAEKLNCSIFKRYEDIMKREDEE